MPDVFLTDFGLARTIATGSRYTRTGQALGTPAYMSPEQARGETGALTAAADVWGVGCLLYELLAGQRAFAGETPAEVIAAVLVHEPPPLARLRPDVPAGVGIVCRVALAKSAAWRFPTCAELRDDLDRVLAGATPHARPPRRRSPVVLAAAAGVAAAVAWLAVTGRTPPPVAPAPAPAAPEVGTLAARAALARGEQPGEAADLLGRALALAPTRHDLRLERGLLFWAVGAPAAARAEWNQIPGGVPEAPWGRFYLGLEAAFRRDGASTTGELLATTREAGTIGRLARAVLASFEKRWPEARAEVRGETGWLAALIRGSIEQGDPAGRPAESLRAFQEGLAGGIRFGWAHVGAALAQEQMGDLAGALAELDAAVRVAPDDPYTWGSRAAVRYKSGNGAGASRDCEAALRLRPGNGALLSLRGVLRHEAGDLEGARQDFAAARLADPESPAVILRSGLSLVDAGDFEGAIREFDEAIRLGPGSADAYYNRGRARQALGDVPAAIADYDAALARDPRLVIAYVNRGLARRALGELTGAIADYDAALALDPRCVNARLNRALARAAGGELETALADCDAAVGVDPRSPEALSARGRIRLALGREAEAAGDLQQALAEAPAGWPYRPDVERALATARGAARR